MSSVLAATLAGNYSAGSAIIAGVLGALAMLMVIYGGLAMGMTRMNLLKTLGTMVMPDAPDNTAYGIGLMMHLMMGAMFGLVHAGILHAFDATSVGAGLGLGIVIGLVHGAIITGIMPIMLTMAHPLVKNGTMDQPGTMMTGYGQMTPMGMVMAHIVFGLVTGAVYVALVI